MSDHGPIFSPTTERAYSRLPDVYREADREQTYPFGTQGVEEAFNYATNPRATSATGFGTYVEGTSEVGTETFVTGASDGPTPDLNSYGRFAVTTAKTAGSGGWRSVDSANYRSPMSGGSGDLVTASVWVRYTGPGTQTVKMRTALYSGTTATILADSGNYTLTSGVWTRFLATAAAPGPFDSVAWWAFQTFPQVLPVGSTLDVTGLLIESGGVAHDYFDGTMDGVEWMGAANASASRRIPVAEVVGGYPLKKFLSATTDVLGDIEELVARFTYLSADERHLAEDFGLSNEGRAIPIGATSDLVDARTADAAWLEWIGQLLGVKVEQYSTEADLRQAVELSDSGFKAGSKAALINSVRTALTGDWEDRTVILYPSSTSTSEIGTGTEWDLLIVTRATVTPSAQAVFDAVIRSGTKPAGVQLYHGTFESSWTAIETNLPTWQQWESAGWRGIEDAGF